MDTAQNGIQYTTQILIRSSTEGCSWSADSTDHTNGIFPETSHRSSSAAYHAEKRAAHGVIRPTNNLLKELRSTYIDEKCIAA